MDDLARIHDALDSVAAWLRVRDWGTSSVACLTKGFNGIESSIVSILEVISHLSPDDVSSVFKMWHGSALASASPASTVFAEAVATNFRRLSVVTFDVRSASTRAMRDAASALSHASQAMAFKGQETTDVLKLQLYRGFDFERKDASAGLLDQMKAIDATAPSSSGVLSGDLLKASEEARERAKQVLVAQRMGVPVSKLGTTNGDGAEASSSGGGGGGGAMGAQVHAGLTGFIVLCRVIYVMEILPYKTDLDRSPSTLTSLGVGTSLADLVPSMADVDVSKTSLQDTWRFMTLACEAWHTVPKTAHVAFRRLLHALCGRIGFFLVHPLFASEVGVSVHESVAFGHVNAVSIGDGDTRFLPSMAFISKVAGILTDMMREVFGVSHVIADIPVANVGPELASARQTLCKRESSFDGVSGSSSATTATAAVAASTRDVVRPMLWRCGMDSVLAAVEERSKLIVTGELTAFGEDVYNGMVVPGAIEMLVQDARLKMGGGMDTETARIFVEDGRVPPETALRILQICRPTHVTLTQHLVMMSPSVLYRIAAAAYLPNIGPDGTDGGMDAVPVPVPSSTLSAVILSEHDFRDRATAAAASTAAAAVSTTTKQKQKQSDAGAGAGAGVGAGALIKFNGDDDPTACWLGLNIGGGGGDDDDVRKTVEIETGGAVACIPSFRASAYTGRRMRMLRFALETYTTDQAAHLASRPDLCGFLFLRLLMSSLAASSSGVVLESFITPGSTVLCQFVARTGICAKSSLRCDMRPTIVPLGGGWFCVVMFDKRGRASRTPPLLSYEAALVWMSLVLVDPTNVWSSESRLQRSVLEHMSEFGVKNHLFPPVDDNADESRKKRKMRPSGGGGGGGGSGDALLFDDARIFRDVLSMVPGSSGSNIVSTSLVQSEVALRGPQDTGVTNVPRPFWRQAITDAGVVPDTMWTSLVGSPSKGRKNPVSVSASASALMAQLQAAKAKFQKKKRRRAAQSGSEIGNREMMDLLFGARRGGGGDDVVFDLSSMPEDYDEPEYVY